MEIELDISNQIKELNARSLQLFQCRPFQKMVSDTLGLDIFVRQHDRGLKQYCARGCKGSDVDDLWDLVQHFLPDTIQSWFQRKCHVFVDESNIHIQSIGRHGPNIIDAVFAGRATPRRFIAGSKESNAREDNMKWDFWVQIGFEIASLT